MSTSRRTFLAAAGAGSAGLGLGIGGAAASPAGGGRSLPLLSTHLAGTERYEAPAQAPALAAGDRLQLRREPEHGYDARAVSVWTPDGQRKLGYVPRVHNQALANLMDAGVAAEGRLRVVKGTSERPDILLDVAIVLPA
ncbi:HIRAN domain-containing protein [uncultured Jannaschia sp.]|uniref:HIRAN domain-containing protein n=1 Tax=uncultured Jannaschia sp. TaxID=293347 RepID=UPI00261F37D8|nr:HIRAN domain-containing protein [uncultured Jannaschia sp.]